MGNNNTDVNEYCIYAFCFWNDRQYLHGKERYDGYTLGKYTCKDGTVSNENAQTTLGNVMDKVKTTNTLRKKYMLTLPKIS